MKIKLLGTGSFNAKSACASAMIDDVILFDPAPETLKKMAAMGVHKTLKVIVVSHFHADHDFDMPTVLTHVTEPVTIIAPHGALTRYRTLCALAHFPGASAMIEKSNVVEIDKNEIANGIEINGYKIQPVPIDHSPRLDCYGYTITKDGKQAAFSGDTYLCDGVHTLLKNAALAFLDITGPAPAGKSQVHMDIPEYEQLKKKYPKCRIIATHMSDDTREKLANLGHQPPNDNEEYEV